MNEHPSPPTDRPPGEAGMQKAHDFAAQVRAGRDAGQRFREAAAELAALHKEAAAHGLALARALAALGEKIEALARLGAASGEARARGHPAAPVRERDAATDHSAD